MRPSKVNAKRVCSELIGIVGQTTKKAFVQQSGSVKRLNLYGAVMIMHTKHTDQSFFPLRQPKIQKVKPLYQSTKDLEQLR